MGVTGVRISPASLGQTGEIADTERHVAAHLQTDFLQFLISKPVVFVAIQCPQNRRSVSAAAAETSLPGDALLDLDGQSVGIGTSSVIVGFGGFVSEILFPTGDSLFAATDLPRLSGTNVDRDLICQGDGLHDGGNIMVAVCPQIAHIQCQVDFGICFFL